MRPIQMVDLKSQYDKIHDEINVQMQQVLDSATFIRGEKVTIFQRNLEKYLHVKHVIPVGNGTDALQIALMALGLQKGDEVITPTFTFIATVEVIALLGLTPVLVDVDSETFCMSPEAVRKAITKKTKAILPVHLFGQHADMEALKNIADEFQLFLVEDACQSMGSIYTFTNGLSCSTGCMGTVGCTSFFPSKNLGCFGDGGALFTNDDALADTIRSIANHGMEVRYHHDRVGVNSRLDSLQAAVLDVKLKYLDLYILARQQAAQFYDQALAGCERASPPVHQLKSTHAFHQYTLKLHHIDRNAVQIAMAQKNVPTMVYYPIPIHLQKAYAYLGYKSGDFPVAEQLSQQVLSLPMHTELDEEQLQYIINSLKLVLQ
ncbi:DegT/DnrJ/EryC1/StrS family aminotransferase [Microbacter margulisiae]|uniref:dTDP-4-amino-4,6-dideoxygalactose transaminase n=1 Tax=Microbacter margulisiae TaxID=1350067 RepID=A0A7W5DSP7_9PORP|nr:DegT/DnrJ/EryC1/StrS family aminotransferase [Microbacter margulisiae]MBB3188033.1 dTDP-4-amino-4,6-dideoxygalactose transaminase [Microbacter margulisiae]